MLHYKTLDKNLVILYFNTIISLIVLEQAFYQVTIAIKDIKLTFCQSLILPQINNRGHEITKVREIGL